MEKKKSRHVGRAANTLPFPMLRRRGQIRHLGHLVGVAFFLALLDRVLVLPRGVGIGGAAKGHSTSGTHSSWVSRVLLSLSHSSEVAHEQSLYKNVLVPASSKIDTLFFT